MKPNKILWFSLLALQLCASQSVYDCSYEKGSGRTFIFKLETYESLETWDIRKNFEEMSTKDEKKANKLRQAHKIFTKYRINKQRGDHFNKNTISVKLIYNPKNTSFTVQNKD